jgi:CelD/BcsL family acetyltransferase involved in cellulose biosynthesis
MAQGIPFRRTAWLHNWWRSYQGKDSLYVLQVTDEWGAVVGIAPWFLEHSLRQGRVVRPLGSGHACSDYLGILTTDEHREQVAGALAQWLTAAAAGDLGGEHRWDLLDLVSWDAQDPMLISFMEQLEAAGSDVFRRPAMSCWRVPLPETWEQYLKQFSKSRRRTLRRMDKQWLNTRAATIHKATTLDELDVAMEILIRLHQERHTSLGRPGCFASEAFRCFLWDAARQFFKEQWFQLYWLEVDGQPLAAEYDLVSNDAVFTYLGGTSTARRDISAGNVLHCFAVRASLEAGMRVFDFLRGDEEYKFHWGVEERACVDLRVVPSRHLSQLRHHVWLAGDTMKQWIRTGLQLTGLR